MTVLLALVCKAKMKSVQRQKLRYDDALRERVEKEVCGLMKLIRKGMRRHATELNRQSIGYLSSSVAAGGGGGLFIDSW